MQVSTANDVKVYNLSSGRTLPEWISDRKKRALLKNDFGEPLSRLVSHVIPSLQSYDSGWSSSKTSPCLSPPRAYRCHVMASTSLLLVYIHGVWVGPTSVRVTSDCIHRRVQASYQMLRRQPALYEV